MINSRKNIKPGIFSSIYFETYYIFFTSITNGFVIRILDENVMVSKICLHIYINIEVYEQLYSLRINTVI